ncbi:MAG: DHHA1 domain-containing protein, partial [Planctomycetota bacterium]
YLRFDFTCPKALTARQIKEVEKFVREKIAENASVTCKIMPRADAEKLGAMALFGEKYGQDVRVVAIGAEDETAINQAFSREFCGGIHVDRTGSIGDFKIIKQESISAGVRRIMAMTGAGLNKYLTERSDIVDELTGLLKAPAEDLVDRVGNLIKENKKLAKKLKSASKGGSDTIAEAKKLLTDSEKIDGTVVIAAKISQTSAEQARTAIDTLKKKAKSAVVVLAFAQDDKVTLLAGVTDDLIARGVKAGEIIREIAPIVEGGGGGRPRMAQAGGENPGKIDECLTKAKKLIKKKLTNS